MGGSIRHIGMLFLLVCSFNLQAQIVEEQPLSFGRIVVVSNDNVGTYSINRFGQIFTTPEFGIFEPGQIGIFRLSGISEFGRTSITVEAVDGNMMPPELGFETFTFSIFDYDDSVRGDENNEAVIRVGGSLQTSGNSSRVFSDSKYSAFLRVIINT